VDGDAGADRAEQVLTEIIETIIVLADHPNAGRAAVDFGHRARKIPSAPYMIYYRPRKNGIEVIHVFHRARDQQTAWRGQKRRPPVTS
jgi:plasmid stabilization system protein ParE